MTLGAAPEALAIGYLRNQRLIGGLQELAAVQVDWETGSVAVTTAHRARTGESIWEADERRVAQPEDVEPAGRSSTRLARRTVTSGCGQGTMFGDLMDEIDDVSLPQDARLRESVLAASLDALRHHDTIYKQAGAVHGCALVSNDPSSPGRPLVFVEDVGRHNAVDAIAGWMWLHDSAGHDKLFYTTGRLTSEMVIKCAQMGIPFLVSRSGLTEMGYRIALRVGITMLGRCRGRHYLLFTGAERFVRDGSPSRPKRPAP
jgi:FdhD protein